MKKNVIFVIGLVVFIIALIFTLNRPPKPKGLIAFVIDDWGYNKKHIERALEIERPITIAILPNLSYSKYIADRFRKDNDLYDIILHLPLESKSGRAEEGNTIKEGMTEEKILSILDDDIKTIPDIVGVSNHQGSKATEDKRVMKIILNELKNRKLFFLDSVTSPKSVCSDIARRIRLKYIQRDVFLDITDQTDLEHFEDYIRKQIRELMDAAIKNGKAIGVGHNKKATLNVIKELIPEIEEKGIKIVPLKELVK